MQEKDVGYNKWTQPGWRIEPSYSNKVLIGNWAEEKLQHKSLQWLGPKQYEISFGRAQIYAKVIRDTWFSLISRAGVFKEQEVRQMVFGLNRLELGSEREFTRQCKTANSTNRLDFRPQLDHRPDGIVRRHALRRSEGLPSRLLLFHHETPKSHNLVSLYDESYSRQRTSDLPGLRTWHSDKMGWIPERSDHPIQGPPTNYGLLESLRARVVQQQGVLPMLSVYKTAYPLHPSSAFCQPRHARAPRLISSNKKNLEPDHRRGNTASLLPPLPCV